MAMAGDGMLALAWVDPPTRFVRFFSRDGRELNSATQAENLNILGTLLAPDDREFFLGNEFNTSTSGFALLQIESPVLRAAAGYVRIEHWQGDHERRKRVIASLARQLEVPSTSDLAKAFAGLMHQDQNRIELHLLAGGAIINGKPIRLTRRSLDILTVLALRRSPVTREALHDALWEFDEPATARTALNVYIHRLRRALGDDAVISHDGAYRLGPRVLVDLHRIEETLRGLSPSTLSSDERGILDRELTAIAEAAPMRRRGTLAVTLQSRVGALARRIGDRLVEDARAADDRFRERRYAEMLAFIAPHQTLSDVAR